MLYVVIMMCGPGGGGALVGCVVGLGDGLPRSLSTCVCDCVALSDT